MVLKYDELEWMKGGKYKYGADLPAMHHETPTICLKLILGSKQSACSNIYSSSLQVECA
jgi:hypothetical protein